MKSASLRAEKGVIEVELIVEKNIITEIKITGDFFIYPEEAIEDIEQTIIGSSTNEKDIEASLSQLYQQKSISTPGITIDDWVKVLALATNK
ncbi:MAG: lipoate protein ligase C-terminal domain-containing protein [Candidatus Heimdallarchaeota archaeon]